MVYCRTWLLGWRFVADARYLRVQTLVDSASRACLEPVLVLFMSRSRARAFPPAFVVVLSIVQRDYTPV
jgi:hypothetical protein